ncbi:MAG: hypothetical protein A2Z72_01115 [Omnitrophica bacterium RBG_13_46_9]|nr:MAG: hypothetical protein A2Z72_01115 [Omnitrophica bacterium RBG_13_46_9]
MRIKQFFLHNIGLKLLALVLAFVTWFYVGEVTKTDTEKTVLQKLLFQPNYISKRVEIKPVYRGVAPAGYKFIDKNVKVTPEYLFIVGSAKILSSIDAIFTKPINLGEYTVSKTVDMELESFSPSIRFQTTKVQVFLPFEKTQ